MEETSRILHKLHESVNIEQKQALKTVTCATDQLRREVHSPCPIIADWRLQILDRVAYS